MILRPRQKLFVERSLCALDTHRNTLGAARTAAGKTITLSGLGHVEAEVQPHRHSSADRQGQRLPFRGDGVMEELHVAITRIRRRTIDPPASGLGALRGLAAANAWLWLVRAAACEPAATLRVVLTMGPEVFRHD